jgi:hypothetical protein
MTAMTMNGVYTKKQIILIIKATETAADIIYDATESAGLLQNDATESAGQKQ